MSEAAREGCSETELQAYLAETRVAVPNMLSVNQAGKAMVEQECHRVRLLVTACARDGAVASNALDELKAEWDVLKKKTLALTDFLAVFRTA